MEQKMEMRRIGYREEKDVGVVDMSAATFLATEYRDKKFSDVESDFTKVLGGSLPWVRPNITADQDEMKQFAAMLTSSSSKSDWLKGALCCLTGFGGIYACCKTHLIEHGQIGFSINSGEPSLMTPGWHLLSSPFNSFHSQVPISTSPVNIGPVTIVRIPQGSVGLAMYNTKNMLLLPGTHAFNDGLLKFIQSSSLSSQLIQFGPIKILSVQTGFVRVCFYNGSAVPLAEGRYAINTAVCIVGPEVDVRQENLKFSKHQVMLDGGVTLECEGLLTYQIVNPVLLTKNMGVDDVERALQDITKAELAKVFASIYLEQLSSARKTETDIIAHTPMAADLDLLTTDEQKHTTSLTVDKKDGGRIVAPPLSVAHEREKGAGEVEAEAKEHELLRLRICAQVKNDITPICAPWGVEIITFQLESTRLQDQKFGAEYEAATLAIAKAKATLKSNAAQNLVQIQQARANAQAARIDAEGKKNSQIILAQGVAEAMRIEAAARQTAASTMTDQFGQSLAILQEKAKLAANLKATTLVLGDHSQQLLPLLPLQKP
jgi:regulator of protease activity HflC (stomatin/prohibitin superfamily)